MRKLLAAVSLILFLNAAAATTVEHEEVSIDLKSSEVRIDLHVEELTSSRLTYFTDHRIEDLSVSIDGKKMECQVYSSEENNQISCETSITKNFTAHIEYNAPNLVEKSGSTLSFKLREAFIRPTKKYSLEVLLPQGYILATSKNKSAVYPPDAQITTDGQRIKLRWVKQPDLGSVQEFRAVYESTDSGNRWIERAGITALILLLATTAYYVIKKLREEELESVYEELEEDEKQVLDLLKNNQGSMLQKDLVERLEYSKAKISGTVSSLVDKEIVEKEKEGRSNRITIRKNYRF